jgi:alcohol dehydrogenase class IV
MYSSLLPLVFGRGSEPEISGSSVSVHKSAAYQFADLFESLGKEFKVPTRLRDVGIQQKDLRALTDDAMKQTRLIPNNIRNVTRDDVLNMYQKAF